MEARWWSIEGLTYTAEGHLPILYWLKGVPIKQFGNEVETAYFIEKLNVKGFFCKGLGPGVLQKSQSLCYLQILFFSLPSQSFCVFLVTELGISLKGEGLFTSPRRWDGAPR